VRPASSLPVHRLTFLALVATAVVAMLACAAPAFAADGVRVIPDGVVGGASYTQRGADISGDFVAFEKNAIPPSDAQTIAVKYLNADAAPFVISNDDTKYYRANRPRILSWGGTIYVVWTRASLMEGWDEDVMIWQGTYDPASNVYTPTDPSFPKPLATGSFFGPAPEITYQTNANIGVTNVGGSDAVIAVWEDSRDNGASVPLVYMMNLTADASYTDPDWVSGGGPQSSGAAIDHTDIWARGQHVPAVGATGIYWLDERWSLWDGGTLSATAVWRADLSGASPVTGSFWTESDPANDNGQDTYPGGGPVATGDGAVWLRSGPYGAWVSQPFAKSVGGSGHVVTWMTGAAGPDAWNDPGATATGFTMMGAPSGVPDAIERDIYAYFPRTGQRIPICDVHWPAGTDPDATPNYYLKYQFDPAIGPASAPGTYRVLWADDRDSQLGLDDSLADPRLYEAFVPGVSLKLRKTHVLFGTRLTLTAHVEPDFTGEKVKLQLVHRMYSHGITVWGAATAYSTVKTLDGSSNAAWSTTVHTHGSFYVRAYFYGGQKYGVDGVSTDGVRTVPHVPNYSNVVKVVY
jgi:hypothetical protein